MTKRIRPTESTSRTIRDVSESFPRVEASQVAAALGGQASATKLEEALAPITLFALREELLNRLQSRGGRPGLADVTQRVKIPMNDKDWLALEELAAAVSSPGFAPSAGQVASVLLTLSVRSLASRLSRSSEEEPSPLLAQELATLAADQDSIQRSD